MGLKNKDLPAFIAIEEMARTVCVEHYGLTKREHFAVMAMQGIMSAGRPSSLEAKVASAVRHADALLKELEK